MPEETKNGGTYPANLERKKAQRLRLMVELYNMVDGFDAQPVETARLAARLGLDTSRPEDLLEVLKIVHYLHGEGLLVASGPAGEVTHLTLTHRGVREVEEAGSRPDLPTEHFSPLGSIRTPDVSTSDPGGAAGKLKVLAEPDRLEVLRMIRSLQEWADKLALNNEQRAEYDADVRTIEAQLDCPHPKTQMIGIALESIKSTTEKASRSPGSAGGIVSAGIASTIERFLAGF